MAESELRNPAATAAADEGNGMPTGTPAGVPTILTTGKIAKFCNVAPRTISKWIDQGLFPGAYRIPGSQDRRVPTAELIEFLRNNKMPIPAALQPPESPVLACIPRMMASEFKAADGGGLIVALDNPFDVAERAARMLRLSLLLIDTLWGGSAEALIENVRRRHPKVAVWALGWQDTLDTISWTSVLYRRPFEPAAIINDAAEFLRPLTANEALASSKRKGAARKPHAVKRIAALESNAQAVPAAAGTGS